MVAPNLRIRKWLLVSAFFGPNLQLSFLWRKLLKLAPPRMLAHWHEACSILKLESLIGTVFAAFSYRIWLVFCITLIFTCVCAIVAAYCQETTKANEPITKAKKPGSQEALRTKARKAMKQKTTKAKKPWPCLRFSNVGPGVEALVDFLPYLFGGLEVLLVRPRWARARLCKGSWFSSCGLAWFECQGPWTWQASSGAMGLGRSDLECCYEVLPRDFGDFAAVAFHIFCKMQLHFFG